MSRIHRRVRAHAKSSGGGARAILLTIRHMYSMKRVRVWVCRAGKGAKTTAGARRAPVGELGSREVGRRRPRSIVHRARGAAEKGERGAERVKRESEGEGGELGRA